jgi:large subunit ribosomal protein L25
MEQVTLEARRRTPDRKGKARRDRREGFVPGVAYGHGLDPIHLLVGAKELSTLLRQHHGTNVLLDLTVDGEAPGGFKAIVKEVQRDPVRDDLLSVDFQWVSLTEKISVTVPVVPVGDSVGVKAGGIFEQALHELHISCLPTGIPQQITVDVSELEQGHSLHVSDLVAPEGVTILTAAEEPVVSVRPPHIVAEVVEAKEGEAVEGEEGEEEAAEAPEAES